MNKTQRRGKILRGSAGIGTVTPQRIEERAREIAQRRACAAKRS